MKRISRNLMGVVFFLLLALTSNLFAANEAVAHSANRAPTISSTTLTPGLDITKFGK